MEILTCIKQVPGTTEVEVDETTGVLKRDGVDSKMNPYDLFALETALRIKQETDATLKVITMGPPQAKQVIEESFMMGADEGAIISDRKFAGADVLATSYTISQGIKKIGNPQIIICGKQTTDGDTAQVGPEIAEFLNIPHVTNVTKILDIKEESIVVEVDMPNTLEVCEVKYPCLLTVEKDIFQPRLPSFKLKIQTKDREIPIFTLNDFEDKDEMNYGLNGSPTQVLKIFPPTPNTDKDILRGSSDELSEDLSNKLKDLKLI
ncbi:electron transfer flavoprotein subunit beta/FixA family protein [Romboutsia ilealis]|uniref:Electron transfer flavoprotein small subunit n=1 Tax=Romboutsia faecis TaxID=2764597 RepID=A0ABR7JM91_9FIRM|nr:electron transfer flavoprotein subunit beta/FixA family protein [Romboutsia faecis]MBC5996033.1 electron transfer flavoprotein subunit beta/FixA family protein [Romboutsia faecis]MRN23233.1 electron transfer flavoprotein subunit beta/FixA family protein [Romboutsia ilealis]